MKWVTDLTSDHIIIMSLKNISLALWTKTSMQTRIHTQSLHFHLCKEFEVDGQMQTDSVQHILVGNTPIQPTYSIECTKLGAWQKYNVWNEVISI